MMKQSSVETPTGGLRALRFSRELSGTRGEDNCHGSKKD